MAYYSEALPGGSLLPVDSIGSLAPPSLPHASCNPGAGAGATHQVAKYFPVTQPGLEPWQASEDLRYIRVLKNLYMSSRFVYTDITLPVCSAHASHSVHPSA